MISIEIPDTKPTVEVDPSLRSELTLFSFDTERYIDGLTLAGVPSEAIDTSYVDFRKDSLGLGYPRVDYEDKKHAVKVTVGPDVTIDSETGTPFPSISHEINFGLAKAAKTMADYVLKQHDTVEIGRGFRGSGLRIAGLGAFTTAGAMLGAGIFEAQGKPVVPGSIVGTILAGGLDAGVLIGIDGLPRNRALSRRMFEHRQALIERATEFANTEEARQLFNDVVRISLAE